jgi:hypothetical protein
MRRFEPGFHYPTETDQIFRELTKKLWEVSEENTGRRNISVPKGCT